jgi:hypothetical protein
MGKNTMGASTELVEDWVSDGTAETGRGSVGIETVGITTVGMLSVGIKVGRGETASVGAAGFTTTEGSAGAVVGGKVDELRLHPATQQRKKEMSRQTFFTLIFTYIP